MRHLIAFLFVFLANYCMAQYSFSGYINPEDIENPVYLSLVEDYRKLSGVHSEQILAKAQADSTGYFEFNGDLLDDVNRIYRIHIDKCPVNDGEFDHFNGYCSDYEALLFIAKNTDTLNLPFSFGKQIFCSIESTNDKAHVFLSIDSLKQDMGFAYSEYRSSANRRLNNKKWFKTFQDYGESLNEPLAELYIYAYLSDRSRDLHSYYVQDLKSNPYYDRLLKRLDANYPGAPYTQQFRNELTSDRYMLNSSDSEEQVVHNLWIYVLLGVSLFINLFLTVRFYTSKKKNIRRLKDNLSKQEQVVLHQLLLDKSNKDIAEALFLSVSTVKSHTNNIYKKLNVKSRDEVKSLFFK